MAVERQCHTINGNSQYGQPVAQQRKLGSPSIQKGLTLLLSAEEVLSTRSFMRTIVNSPSRERSPHSAEAVMSFFYPRSGRRRPSHNVIRTRVFNLHSALRGAERVTHSPGTGHRCFRQRRFMLFQRAANTCSGEADCRSGNGGASFGLEGRHLLPHLL